MKGSPEESPLVAVHPSVEEKTNIMTLEELDALRDTYSFPSGVQIRLPDEGETITSTRPVEFYNICPTQLVPNVWRSIACSMALWRVYKYSISLSEFRNLFSLNCNPKPDQDWLYFKARNKKVLLGGYPSNVKGWKSKFFFVSSDEWEIPEGTSRVGAPRVPRTWGIPAMSKRVSFKKIGEKLGKAAGASSGAPVLAKGVIIGEKRPGESITSSPSKKGKVNDGSKGKGVVIGPEGKKKATSFGKALTPPTTASPRPGEGSSANLGTVLGPTASMLGSPSVAEKLLRGGDSPSRQGEGGELTLDQTATKLFHVIGQALVLGSSLAVRSREAGEQASLQEGRAASMETEITRLQKVVADLEQQLAQSHARELQANEELAKAKSDRDSLSDKFERSGVLVNELREALNKSKEFVVEEFKSSSEFMVAVEDSASKYFGESFNFCKVQLRRHHPDLAIDLEGTVVDQDLLAEQDEANEENEKEKTGENEGGN
ncbi:hypothetical protein Acr_14g0004550 [Actinidia rufa]|uniref:Uncharacterized protein n=1 Tax=Actinidia rufa TaxID=165716 RepID=A0A7J0FRM4_9ERIC|nr:hypothetical protein Acr_14g0004550 [Actinidia rufa]